MRRLGLQTFIIATLVILALTGCGSKDKKADTSTTTTTAKAAALAGTVNVGTTDLGKVLVDTNGMTLYLYEKDSADESKCVDACAESWPPLSGSTDVGTGLESWKLTTITRADGTKQLVFNGHPLYLWQGDSKAGDTTGEGVSGFYVVTPAGEKLDS